MMPPFEAVAVLTTRSVSQILADQGLTGVTVDVRKALRCRFLVCVRSQQAPDADCDHASGAAFLVGRISGAVQLSRRQSLVRFNEVARVEFPFAWKGGTHPVHYTSLEELGIIASELRFEDLQRLGKMAFPAPVSYWDMANAPLSIPAAKERLALTLGVDPSQIGITIQGLTAAKSPGVRHAAGPAGENSTLEGSGRLHSDPNDPTSGESSRRLVDAEADWENELGRWLKPFLEKLGHKARQRMCSLYVAGLIGPGDRKSVQPMADRLAPCKYDRLHHFVAASAWDIAPLEMELLVQADKLAGGSDAVLAIGETTIAKKGKHSVGVAPQHAAALGKTTNCQTLVSLMLARGEVPVAVALRLFLPEIWTRDTVRLERAGVPAAHRSARTKPEIALAEIDRVIAAGLRFGCVLADADFGQSEPFWQGLVARRLTWAVGISRRLKVHPIDTRFIEPVGAAKAAEDILAEAKWQTLSWRNAPTGKLEASFAAVRVHTPNRPLQQVGDKNQEYLSGDEVWLIGEHTTSDEKKYYLANLPAGMELRTLAATINARWTCDQAHQQLKEELGLGHFEGRFWLGLHRHALMAMIAYAFLQHRRQHAQLPVPPLKAALAKGSA